PGQCRRGEDVVDRLNPAGTRLESPPRELETTTQQEEFARRTHGEERRSVWLFEAVVRAIVLRRVHAESVEADLRRIAPSSENRQVSATIEQAGRDEFGLDAFVVLDAVAATHVQGAVGREVP